MTTIAEMFATLPVDRWRRRHPFSRAFADAHRSLISSQSDQEASQVLSQWVQEHQPCIFGKIAARLGLLRFCFLRESDLADETTLHLKLQKSRTAWKRDAWNGRSHGFVIVLLSDKVARASPSPELLAFAARLCSLYLLVEVTPDTVYLDELYFEFPLPDKPTRRWSVGVNYFAANAEGRWWQDHRMPGGLAFSMNSVGHMAAAGNANEQLENFSQGLGFPANVGDESNVTSLARGLVLAMQTIKNASTSVSGKATELVPLSEDCQEAPCPVELPQGLRRFSHRVYRGWYHTDYTLPSVYFHPAAARSKRIPPNTLDFTYFHGDSVSNPDYYTMGVGVQIRDQEMLSSADNGLKRDLSQRFLGEELDPQTRDAVKRNLGLGNQV